MKTYDLAITHNDLHTKNDVVQSLLDILAPCEQALVNENSGIFINNEFAQHSPQCALLEGWSRLLWGIVPLRAGGYNWKGQEKHFEGLIAGTNPESDNYWGDVNCCDQRMVEMAPIVLGLLLTPEHYWTPLTNKQQDNLCSWLGMINKNDLPHNNWLYFRILVNVAFEKLNRKEFDKQIMESDLCEIDAMYAEDGWYHDRVPFDYYNPWAMQFYSLVYYSFRKDIDCERCTKIEQRVKLFAQQYQYYFNAEGEFVPYGRSLTYRFGAVSFFSACAFANIEVLPWGVMKGIVLRNLRWWFKQPIFDRDGFLTVGFVIPSQIIAEQYNAPGSPYWGLKTYLMLAISKNHPFWTSKELALPKLEKTKLLKAPNIIVQRTSDDDVIFLNGGQYPQYHLMHIAEKYAKFAYSAHYAFSVSSSYYDFEKCGCDSMLFFSEDGEYFRPRREIQIIEKNEKFIASLWHPYKDVEVCTYLIPAKDYHVRVHKIVAGRDVQTREGGFAIPANNWMKSTTPVIKKEENESSIYINFPWDCTMISDVKKQRKAVSIRPTPNLNCMASNVLVPVLEGNIKAGEKRTYVTLVGASHNSKNFYNDKPCVIWDDKNEQLTIDSEKIILK
jgi:hypothetical protein